MNKFNCYEHMFRNYAQEFLDELSYGFEAQVDRTGVGRYMFEPCCITIRNCVWPLDMSRKINQEFSKKEFEMFVIKKTQNIKALGRFKSIWKPWADETGKIGKHSYPSAFKHLDSIIDNIVSDAMVDGMSTTNVLTTWKNSLPAKNEKAWAEKFPDKDCKYLQTCHGSFIHFIVVDNTLNMTCVQRSGDIPLGIPHNLLFYKRLLLYVKEMANSKLSKSNRIFAGDIDYIISAPHFYINQADAVRKQLDFIKANYPTKMFAENNLEAYNAIAPKVVKYNLETNDVDIDMIDCPMFAAKSPDIKYPKAAV